MDRLDPQAPGCAATFGRAPDRSAQRKLTTHRSSFAAALGLVVVLGGLPAGDPAPARASVVQALSLVQLTHKADEVLLAVPTAKHARRHVDGKLIVTDVELSVEDVLKGPRKPGGTAVATVLGGALDGVGLQVPGEASFALGQRVLVFLYRAERSGDLRVVGMSQGVLPVQDDGGRTLVLPGGGGAALVERDESGTLADGQPAMAGPQPLGEVVARIRAIVAQQQRPAK